MGERYRVERELGAGGMGVVYEAVDETLGRTVALKMLRTDDEVSPEAVARLEREARAAAKLGHPNIVRVLDVGRLPDGAFLVMERLEGETLDERIDRLGALPLEPAVRIHLQLLDALAAAHEEGVLHRDVKPSNVFLTTLADGSELVKLLDFGIAYLAEDASRAKLTATGIALGTPAYMAPERVLGRRALDPRTDLYSVGVSLFESLTGKLPFVADTPIALRGRILLDQAPSLSTERPELSAGIAAVVARALAKEPRERFESAVAMAAALRECVGAPEPSRSGTRLRPKRAIGAPDSEAVTGGVPSLPPPSGPSQTRPLGDAVRATQETVPALPTPRPPSTPVPPTRASIEPVEPRHETLPFGGRTRPPAPVTPRTTPRPRAAATRSWMLGLGGGLAAGGMSLAVLTAVFVAAPPSPSAPGEPPRPTPVATPRPATRPVPPAVVSPAPRSGAPAALTDAAVATPEPLPAVEPRPRARRPAHPRPLPEPVIGAPVEPSPPRPVSVDEPLEPEWKGWTGGFARTLQEGGLRCCEDRSSSPCC